jgi:NTE family protein
MTTAWVMRGGSSFSAAQVGMARALLEAGHHPDLLLGSSAGALNAAWLAADPTLEGLVPLGALWAAARRRDIFPLRPWVALPGVVGLRDHTVNPKGLARWLRAHSLLRRLEDGALPLTVVATDLETGEEVLLEDGPALPALLATSAMPGIFPPVRLGGRWLIDGSIAMDTAIGPAVTAGADRVWVLDSIPAVAMARPRAALDVVLRASSILLARSHAARLEAWGQRCELYVVPAPLVPGVSPFDFRRSREIIDAAYQHARAWLATAKPVPAATTLPDSHQGRK